MEAFCYKYTKQSCYGVVCTSTMSKPVCRQSASRRTFSRCHVLLSITFTGPIIAQQIVYLTHELLKLVVELVLINVSWWGRYKPTPPILAGCRSRQPCLTSHKCSQSSKTIHKTDVLHGGARPRRAGIPKGPCPKVPAEFDRRPLAGARGRVWLSAP